MTVSTRWHHMPHFKQKKSFIKDILDDRLISKNLWSPRCPI